MKPIRLSRLLNIWLSLVLNFVLFTFKPQVHWNKPILWNYQSRMGKPISFSRPSLTCFGWRKSLQLPNEVIDNKKLWSGVCLRLNRLSWTSAIFHFHLVLLYFLLLLCTLRNIKLFPNYLQGSFDSSWEFLSGSYFRFRIICALAVG